MIIKVPVYVEIPDVKSDLIHEVADNLATAFTKILRKENFDLKSSHFIGIPKEVRNEFSARILTKDKALDSLRTKK